MRRYKFRSQLRRQVSGYPMSQRRVIRQQLTNPKTNINGRYSRLMRHAGSKKAKKISRDTRPWYRRLKPSTKTKERISKVTKSKTLRNGLIGVVAVGTTLAVLPKETLGDAADTVQKFGENVYDMAEDMGSTTGSLVRAVGTTADVMSNGLSFMAENFGTLVTLGIGGWLASRVLSVL